MKILYYLYISYSCSLHVCVCILLKCIQANIYKNVIMIIIILHHMTLYENLFHLVLTYKSTCLQMENLLVNTELVKH